MREFDFPLEMNETMTIRRVLKPLRVLNKGAAIYRMETLLWPVLEENGWGFISENKKDRSITYCRSPNGQIAETFNIHARVPADNGISRFLGELKNAPGLKHLGHWERPCYAYRLGSYIKASFYPCGDRYYYDWDDPEDAPKGTPWQWNMPPALGIRVSCLWSMDVFWPNGLDNQPVWQRHQTYSGLMPHLDYRGMPIADQNDSDG